jgi:hypothetical protein
MTQAAPAGKGRRRESESRVQWAYEIKQEEIWMRQPRAGGENPARCGKNEKRRITIPYCSMFLLHSAGGSDTLSKIPVVFRYITQTYGGEPLAEFFRCRKERGASSA